MWYLKNELKKIPADLVRHDVLERAKEIAALRIAGIIENDEFLHFDLNAS